MKHREQKHLLLWAYLAALVLWLLQGALGLAQGAWYQARGLAPQLTLMPDQLELVSVVPYAIDYEPVPGYWVSTDHDPQIYLYQQLWVDTVVLDVDQNKPAGGVELYYREPGQADFSARQVVYPQRDEAGRFVFRLGGRRVDALRIDPDSVGGVLTQFRGLQINPPTPWYWHFVPDAGQAILLLVLPLAAAALVCECTDLAVILHGKRRKTEES